MSQKNGTRIALLSLHGLIRGENLELGRDEDTGGQTKYVVELARALAAQEDVRRVDLITRQIFDDRVSEDYARSEEPLGGGAFIVRIPFGPRRYLYKTKLWPYMEQFVDQCLNYFQRNRAVPDLIHGHYADAGYGGAQLARLLGVPFVFTGHSLGRVKKERLLASGVSEKKIENSYRISRRIEAEEFALETCSLIITSTHQEVRQQYEKYENYIPERMEVIPPGVNLESFRPPRDDDPQPEIAPCINRFLDDPSRPMIVAMARPDERKNLERLVTTFGESEDLRRRANLVLVMGCRDDLREMPPGQRAVLTNILALIDVYDLYGQVAYPKHHRADDVPEIYRMIARTRGVFINPAMTEPFGLTLLEAAASGVPIVATNDGGPSDIIANCRNGILVDPFDSSAIEKALLRTLSEPGTWDEWSVTGHRNVHEHYSWSRHAERYLRDVNEVLEVFREPPKPASPRRKTRPLTGVDRIVIADIDNTLTGDDEAMRTFFDRIEETGTDVGFGIATGRRFEDVMRLMEENGMPQPEVVITSVGTEIYYGKNLTPDASWRKHIDFRWEPEKIREILDPLPGLYPQEEHEQSTFKISYGIDFSESPGLSEIKRMLRNGGARVKVVVSLGMFLDIIPARAGSGLCIRHMAYKWGFPLEHILVAGDSGNDEEMLAGNTLGVVVGNYSRELEKLRKFPRIYFAESHHAAGILEGMDYYDFLGDIAIPNDRTAEAEAGQ